MRSSLNLVIVICVTLVMGGVAGWWLHGQQLSRIPDTWYEVNPMHLAGDGSNLGYTSEALFGSDIPLPTISRASAKMKFLPAQDGTSYMLGYIVTIDIMNLDSETIPAK